jgi:hypothetical protein
VLDGAGGGGEVADGTAVPGVVDGAGPVVPLDVLGVGVLGRVDVTRGVGVRVARLSVGEADGVGTAGTSAGGGGRTSK